MPDEPPSSLTSRAVTSGRWTAISALSGLLAQFVQLAILGRLLDPADFGLMAMMMVVIGMACLFSDLGISNYLVHAKKLDETLLGSLLAICVLCGLALTMLIVLLSPWVALGFQSPALAAQLPAFAFVVAATSLSQPLGAWLQRNMLFRAIAIIEIQSILAGFMVSVGLAWAGRGVWALIGGQIALALVKAALSWQATLYSSHLPIRLDLASCRKALGFGSYQMGERLFAYGSLNIDKIIVGRLLGDGALGLYSVIYQLVSKPFSVLNPVFTRVAFPLFSQLQNDDARLCRHYIEMSRIIALLSFPIYMVMILSSDLIIAVLLGDKWSEAGRLLSLLGWLGFVFSLGNPVGTLILAKGRADLGFYYTGCAMFVYAASCAIGARSGIMGVACGFLIAAAGILFPLDCFLRWKLVRMSPWSYLYSLRHLLAASLIPLALGMTCLAVSTPGHERNLAEAALSLAAVAVFAGWMWLGERDLVCRVKQLALGQPTG